MPEGKSAFSRSRVSVGDHAVVHWKNVAIFVWGARPTGESTRAGVEFAGELMKEHASFSVVHVAEETAGLPTTEARGVFAEVLRSKKQTIAAIGLLLPRSAVLGTLLRTFVRGLRTVLRMPLDVIIADDLAVLATTLTLSHQKLTGVHFQASELADAIQAARRLARGQP